MVHQELGSNVLDRVKDETEHLVKSRHYQSWKADKW